MAKVTALTTVTVIVVVTASIVASEKRPFLHYSKYLQKALPDHWQHDQENLNRRVDTIAWRHQVRGVEPPLPPLRDPPPLSWQSWAKRGRRAAKEGYRDKEREKVRTQQLQEKLRLNHLQPKRVGVIPHPRPRVEERNHLRRKRQVETESKSFMEKLRSKRDVVISPQLKPEMVMQQRIEPSLQQDKEEQYQENVKEKREKRQIVYLVNQPPEWRLYKQSRTTPNPFIRETNMDDYEIVRPNPNPGPTGSRQESYQLNEEASEFSKIISEFYLATSNEHWPDIEQFAANVLNPFSRIFYKKSRESRIDMRKIEEYNFRGTETSSKINDSDLEKMSTVKKDFIELFVHNRLKRQVNKRKRKKRKKKPKLVGKLYYRKMAKKRKQKQNRVERKRLRMLTHARRLRKQHKSKLARLERHYARMNLTTTAVPGLVREHPGNKTAEERAGGEAIDTEQFEEYDVEDEESSGTEEYEEDNSEDDGSGDDEYEEYEEEEESNNEYEDVEYENVEDEPDDSKKTDRSKEGGKDEKNNTKQRTSNKQTGFIRRTDTLREKNLQSQTGKTKSSHRIKENLTNNNIDLRMNVQTNEMHEQQLYNPQKKLKANTITPERYMRDNHNLLVFDEIAIKLKTMKRLQMRRLVQNQATGEINLQPDLHRKNIMEKT